MDEAQRYSFRYPDENRGFKAIDVFSRPRQWAEQRFGKKFNLQELEPMVGNSYDEGCFQETPHSLPQFEMHRMNLTALSQFYNLYFVAFRNQIYVYRPRNLDQSVPGKPDLVIRPPPLGLGKPGSIFPDHPHCVNSLVVGDLGNLEILLLAFDDGNVYAYYTKDIEACVRRHEIDKNSLPLSELRHFFGENLEDSAWGLAIHKSLRIIAVSSNDHMIRLFCFALKSDEETDYESALDPTVAERLLHNYTRTNWLASHELPRPDDRHRNIKVIIDLGSIFYCNNIPTLAFSNYGIFEQEILVGVDIEGMNFIVHLSRMIISYNKITPRKDVSEPALTAVLCNFDMGWAMTLLEPEFFMSTNSVEDTFGNAYRADGYRKGSEEHAGYLGDVITVDGRKHKEHVGYSGVVYKRHVSKYISYPKLWPSSESSLPSEELLYSAMFYTSAEDIALMPIFHAERHSLLTVCRKPLAHCTPRETYIAVLQQARFPERLSMLVKIPDLSLVIVGSPVGLVALFTPTCTSRSIPFEDGVVLDAGGISFRIDAVLPSHAQQLRGDRPSSPLMGIAVAPIQAAEDLQQFRLLLYYYDHTILSYELSRTAGKEELNIRQSMSDSESE